MDKKELQAKIRELVKKRDALFLAHNYQRAEIQEIADITGDSLGLSMQAAKTKSKVILFAGVHFMAETAYILSPKKTVLLPRMDAGCPMADMITVDALKKKKKELKGIPVVTYVNTPADVKAESDICCTSANAVAVLKSLKVKEVLMTPDRNLALYVQRHVKTKIHLWEGYCNIHDRLRADHIKQAKKSYPRSVVIAHPECRPEVLDLADEIRSTSGMLAFCKESKKKNFIIATENGLLYQLREQNPEKKFYQASRVMLCPNMKITRLEDIYQALKTMDPVVTVPEKIRKKALRAVNKMLAVPRD